MSTESKSRWEEIEDGVDEEGIIDDAMIHTEYCRLEYILEDSEHRYLRIVGDNKALNAEIRVPFEYLEDNGWFKKEPEPEPEPGQAGPEPSPDIPA